MRIDYLRLTASLIRVDPRILYLCVALAVAIPLLFASKARVVPSEESEGFHRAVQRIAEGETVLLSTDVNNATAFELEPMITAFVQEVFARKGRLIVVCTDAQGTGRVEQTIEGLAAASGASYGADWVFLGYRPSSPATIVSLASSPYTVFPADYRGRPLSSMPLTSSLSGHSDYRLVTVVASGPSAQDWVIYGHGRFAAPIIVGLGGGIGPAFQGFVDRKLIAGLIAGLRGAAEYEVLSGRPAEAVRALSAQSMAHLLLVALVIVGNAAFFATKWLERVPG